MRAGAATTAAVVPAHEMRVWSATRVSVVHQIVQTMNVATTAVVAPAAPAIRGPSVVRRTTFAVSLIARANNVVATAVVGSAEAAQTGLSAVVLSV